MYFKLSQLIRNLSFTALLAPSFLRIAGACSTLDVSEISLGFVSETEEVKADVYTCPARNAAGPLVVLAGGGSVRKSSYTMFATGLAEYGYAAMVLNHPKSFGPGEPLNFANSKEMSNAIQYARESIPEADADTTIILGFVA